MTEEIRSVSRMLKDACALLPADAAELRVADIITIFHERGFGFLLFVFALPAALPLPGLGINLLIATPLLFLTGQQALGRHTVWFPDGIREKTISRARFVSFVESAEPFFRRFEFLIAPRLGFVTQGVFSNFIGLCGIVMASSILVPLPLTNTVPAMGIAGMALGVLMRDGLAVIAGMALGLCWVAMLVFVVATLGVDGMDAVRQVIKGMLE